MLAIGLGNMEAYRQLPVVGQANDVWHWTSLFSFWPILGLVYLVYGRRHPSYIHVPLSVLTLLALVNNYPFTVSRWNPHWGDMGSAPYQHYIDYVNQRGGLAFWAGLEQRNERPLEPMFRGFRPAQVKTDAHVQDLVATRDYGGFISEGGPLGGAQKIGSTWDQALTEFVAGERRSPSWFMGVRADKSKPFDGETTVFLVREKSRRAILESIRQGRMYAVDGKPLSLRLERFEAVTEKGRTLFGGLVASNGKVRLGAKVTKPDRQEEEVSVTVVKDGRVVARVEGQTPMEFNHLDYDIEPGKRSYYRLMVKSANAELTANPVFVDGVSP